MKTMIRFALIGALLLPSAQAIAQTHLTKAPEVQTIDILIAFTAQAAERIQESGAALNIVGTSDLQDFAERAVSRTNAALDKSGLHDRFSVAGVYRTGSETGRGEEHHVRRLINPNDGVFDDVHAERERLGADVVTLIYSARQLHNECGMVVELPNSAGSNEARAAFAVVHWLRALDPNNDCFAHEAGHLLGATHANAQCGNILFSGRNYSDRRSIMAHPSPQCPLSLPFYSWPNVRAMSRHVAIVAGYRMATETPAAQVAILPFFPGAHGPVTGIARVICPSCRGTVQIWATDDTGDRRGPVEFEIDSFSGNDALQFNSEQLEGGSRLFAGVGNGQGHWWLEFRTDLTKPITVSGYTRTRDGFLASAHDVVPRQPEMQSLDSDRDYGYFVTFFNPASNTSLSSVLRIVNPQPEAASVQVNGIDARGVLRGSHVFDLPAGGSVNLTSAYLEAEAFERGTGKWRLRVYADRPVWVMSLLRTRSGHISNLSTMPPAPTESPRP